jgi:peroxiredoxin
MFRRILICSALIFMMVLPFASGEDKAPRGESGSNRVGPYKITAPDFSLQDITGKTWRLSDYRGKLVFMDFTTTWCPWCLRDIPILKKIYDQYRGQDFVFLSIYIQESQRKVASFAGKHALPYAVLLDTEGKVARIYNIRGVPTKVIVARDGTIACWMCSDVEGFLGRMLKK